MKVKGQADKWIKGQTKKKLNFLYIRNEDEVEELPGIPLGLYSHTTIVVL